MRTVKYKSVFDQIVRRHGLDPDGEIPADTANGILDHLNQRVVIGWEMWPWPEFEKTEERAFAPAWDTAASYTAGDIVWWSAATGGDGQYHAAVVNVSPGGPNPSNTGTWRVAMPVRVIDLDATGQTVIGQVFNVFDADPRVTKWAGHIDFEIVSTGLSVPCGPATVWVVFQQPPPVFTNAPPITADSYAAGTLYYLSTAQDCYIALAITTKKPGTDTGWEDDWTLVQFPQLLSAYVVAGAYADGMSETDPADTDAGVISAKLAKANVSASEAERYIQREIDKLLAQSYRRRVYRDYWRAVA